MKRNIIIVGGGVAGYTTALLTKQMYTECNVTVLTSEKIGILGAGEGTIPGFISELKAVGLYPDKIVKHAGGTFKGGIAFAGGWGHNQSFFHPFHEDVIADLPRGWNRVHHLLKTNQAMADMNFNSQAVSNIMGELCRSNKAPMQYTKERGLQDLFSDNFALHYDVVSLVQLMKETSISNGIRVVIGTSDDVVLNQRGYITHIVLDDGRRLACDYAFDCTGFRRSIISKVSKTFFNNTTDVLTVNAAIAYRMPHAGTGGHGPNNSIIRPYTIARSMNAGWEWTIPVWDDLRRGYIYDNRHCTEEQAHQEVCELYNQDVEILNKFNFSSGYLQDFAIKNCAAIGLAAGFFEPLEATANAQILHQIHSLLPVMFSTKEYELDVVNKNFRVAMGWIHDFLLLHYLNNTSKQGHGFWDNFSTGDDAKKQLDYAKKLMLTNYAGDILSEGGDNLQLVAYIATGLGLRDFSRDVVEILKHRSTNDLRVLQAYDEQVMQTVNRCMDHSLAIKMLRD